jgi:hypothetical protein
MQMPAGVVSRDAKLRISTQDFHLARRRLHPHDIFRVRNRQRQPANGCAGIQDRERFGTPGPNEVGGLRLPLEWILLSLLSATSREGVEQVVLSAIDVPGLQSVDARHGAEAPREGVSTSMVSAVRRVAVILRLRLSTCHPPRSRDERTNAHPNDNTLTTDVRR